MRVWDAFVRLYHWSQLCLLGGLWFSAEQGAMDWHFFLAYVLAALLLTRIVWGWVGSDTARFSHFVRSPFAVIRHLRQAHASASPAKKRINLGHSPLGAYMILALLLSLSLQTLTGLFSFDDFFAEGPLYPLVDESVALIMMEVHHLNFQVILALVALHVGTIVFLLLSRENLIKPMITGFKHSAEAAKAQALRFRHAALALTLFALLCALIFSLVGNPFAML